MEHILTITTGTTDGDIEEAMPFEDMRTIARASRAYFGGGYQLFSGGGFYVLWHPVAGCAIVNEISPGEGKSFVVFPGFAASPEDALLIYGFEKDFFEGLVDEEGGDNA